MDIKGFSVDRYKGGMEQSFLGISVYLAWTFDEYRWTYLTCPGSLYVLIQPDRKTRWGYLLKLIQPPGPCLVGPRNGHFAMSATLSCKREVWKSAETRPWLQGSNQTRLSPWGSCCRFRTQVLKVQVQIWWAWKSCSFPWGSCSVPRGLVLSSHWDLSHSLMSASSKKHVVRFYFSQFALWKKWHTLIFVFKYEIVLSSWIYFFMLLSAPPCSPQPRESWELWWVPLCPLRGTFLPLSLVWETPMEDA